MTITNTNEGTFIIFNDVAMKVVGRTATEIMLVFNGKSYHVKPTTEETIKIFNELHKPLSGI
jgi:hypothetical protein